MTRTTLLSSQLKSLDTSSITTRARTSILEAILSGQFDGRLPTEQELAEMLGVSRTTVRAALLDLEIKGMITRRRARGTTVNVHVHSTNLALDRLIGFDWLLREKGYHVKVTVSHTISPVDKRFTSTFGVPAETECCMITKLYSADGVIAIGIVDAIPADQLNTRRLPKALPPSVFDFTAKYCKEAINHATVDIVPMVASGLVVPMAKSVPLGRPFLRLHETHYSDKASVLGWSLIDVNDKYVRFSVVRRQ